MKNRYSKVLVEYENQFHWCVFEHSTEQVIASFFFEDDAEDYLEFLEDGGAFDGFTPAFMLVEARKPDVNAKFEQLIA